MKNTFDARKRNLGIQPSSEGRNWRRIFIMGGVGGLLIVAIGVGFAIWYSLTHVTTLRASVSAAVVSLATDVDARMVELYVQPGQRVEKGEALARLDDTALRAALASAEADRAIRESQVAQSKAHARMVEAQAEADIVLARARVEMATKRVAGAELRLAMRKEKIPEEIRRAQAYRDEALARLQYLKKGARKEEIEVAKARLATARAREALCKYQVKQTETLVKRRVESPLDLKVAETEHQTQQNEAREAELRLQQLLAGPTGDQVEAAKQALEARDAALALVRAREEEIPVVAAELAIREAELREAGTALTRAEAKRHEIAVAKERVKAAEAELRRARADVDERQAVLKRMTIVSPVTGTVIQTFDHVGEVCRKGVTTILVADDSKGRWIEGYVREDDAGLLREGQTARVELVMGSGYYVKAAVEAVGLSTSAIDRNDAGGLGSRSYAELVWVKLRPVSKMGNVRPGMSARAVIRVRGAEATGNTLTP